jgi:hypothetical protein
MAIASAEMVIVTGGRARCTFFGSGFIWRDLTAEETGRDRIFTRALYVHFPSAQAQNAQCTYITLALRGRAG